MLKHLKITEKFILSFIIITIGPLLTVAYLSYSNSKYHMERKIIDAFSALNNARAANINNTIRLRLEQARELAGTFVTRQLSVDGNNEAWLVHKMQGHVESVFNEMKLIAQSHYRNIDKPSEIESIGIIDVNGKIIVNTQTSLVGQVVSSAVVDALRGGGTYFGGLWQDPATKQAHIVIFDEARDWEGGGFAGAIMLRVKGDILDDITTDRTGLGETGENYIVNRNLEMITKSRFVKDASFNLKVNTKATRQCFSEQNGSAVYRGYHGNDVLGVFTYLPDQDWCMISEMNIEEAFASVEHLRKFVTLLILIVVILIFVFFNVMNNIFIKPIIALRNATHKVGEGDLEVRVNVKGNDELGELTQAFNKMTVNLKEDKEILEGQKKDLEKVNKELDSFVHTASHDLRAPLRGIISFATFLEDDFKDKLDTKGKDYLKEILQGAGRLNRLIEDLLELSRISRVKNPYEKVDIKGVIAEVRAQLKYDIEDKNVSLIIAENLPTVVCDPIKIKTAFLNLINNAIKFSSKENKIRPRIEIGYNDSVEGHHFFVKDNGIGIAPQFHEKVFDLFRKLHPVGQYEGTGAGLSIVQRIIEDQGGRIWIDSKEGEGATFWFIIPKGLKDKDSM